MKISNNELALYAYHKVANSTKGLNSSLKKLASGIQISNATDNAAGLAISEKMRGQVRGLLQAQRNIQDGISLIQVAEGGLNEIHSNLQRMRELSVYSSNDTLTAEDRNIIQKEIEQLKQGIDNIANNTEFNGIKLLNVPKGDSYYNKYFENDTISEVVPMEPLPQPSPAVGKKVLVWLQG